MSRDIDLVGIAESAATGMGILRLRDGDVSMVAPPFFHALGFSMCC